MMTVAHRRLSRRTLLQGAGAAIALPMLEAMKSAFGAPEKTLPVRRLAVVYVPNGIVMKDWLPAGPAQGFEFPRILKPLEPFRESLTIVSG